MRDVRIDVLGKLEHPFQLHHPDQAGEREACLVGFVAYRWRRKVIT